jgi:hypothetical protein
MLGDYQESIAGGRVRANGCQGFKDQMTKTNYIAIFK